VARTLTTHLSFEAFKENTILYLQITGSARLPDGRIRGKMNRKKLGELLQQWHSSMSDPIYAVGSFYFSDWVYPNPLIVRDAIHSLEHTLQENKDMLEGKPVMVVRQERTIDLKEFAGYSDEELQDNINELMELIASLRLQFKEDLCNHFGSVEWSELVKEFCK